MAKYDFVKVASGVIGELLSCAINLILEIFVLVEKHEATKEEWLEPAKTAIIRILNSIPSWISETGGGFDLGFLRW